MTDKRRDVLDGIGGYVPGPWYATRHPYWPNAMVRVSTRPGDSWSNFGQICYATPAEAELIARAPELVEEVRALREAIRNVADRRARPGDSHNDHFERLAAMFERETGRMAPGKDQPMEMGARDIEADRAAWESWCAAPYEALVALLPDTGDNDES